MWGFRLQAQQAQVLPQQPRQGGGWQKLKTLSHHYYHHHHHNNSHPSIIIITTTTSKHIITMITITSVITRWAAKADELSSELEQVILMVVAIYLYIPQYNITYHNIIYYMNLDKISYYRSRRLFTHRQPLRWDQQCMWQCGILIEI